ncbi:transcriptional regulator [Schizosaccharomyces japonicus yFS275]|uniref:Transcriptional regulator n=1 Tax=Schizosaccharomyces japonicus (strain yFS275 / FY16936) TaxID=402676 RepID=B6K442_SCHJY|nr:transcriptional regulator [Schizosaccharomyces japonicus yFS275]EEB08249.1 transcriptional regulator [Schizosaccharomyces japonicus yFS275]
MNHQAPLVAYASEDEEEAEKEDLSEKPCDEQFKGKFPASPPNQLAAPVLNEKFHEFLRLKDNGVHFHMRLLENSDFQNPNLLDSLEKHIHVEDPSGSMLPAEIWDRKLLPKAAYARTMYKAQEDNDVERRKKRNAIAFKSEM